MAPSLQHICTPNEYAGSVGLKALVVLLVLGAVVVETPRTGAASKTEIANKGIGKRLPRAIFFVFCVYK